MQELHFFGIADDRMHLAHRAVGAQNIFFIARLNAVVVIEIGEVAALDEERFQLIGIDGGKTFHEVEVIRPMVDPKAFTMRGVLNLGTQASVFASCR